jgi:hypothetical protein
MTHRKFYLELTNLSEVFREKLKSAFSINALVQLTDHSLDETVPQLADCIKSTSIAYQFQLDQQRGFIMFSNHFGEWLVSELLGVVVPSQRSTLEEYSYQLFINDVFSTSKLFSNFQRVEASSVWVHPTFDQFYPMSLTVFKSRSQPIKNWCFIPKEPEE